MTDWLRWQYSLPRVALAAVLFLAAEYALCLVANVALTSAIEETIGAEVDLRHARVFLPRRSLVLRDLRAANPFHPLDNLLEVDRCALEIDALPLAHRRVVVENGAVTGLRMGTPREATGALDGRVEGAVAPRIDWFSDRAPAEVSQWLEALAEKFEPGASAEFESVRLADQVVARWPDEFGSLELRLRELRERADELQAELQSAQVNPLRHVEMLRQMPDRLAALRREFDAFEQELDNLPASLDAERRAILAARERDELLLREKLAMPTIDARTLSAYLLQQEVAQRLDDVIGWLRWARQAAPDTAGMPHERAGRGETVHFVGAPRQPDLLIRQLSLQGTTRLGGQSIEFRGTLSDLASPPALHPRPMRLRLTSHGALPMELQATIDRTGKQARDELLVDCQNLMLPELQLGRSERLRLRMAPSVASMNVSLLVEGDRLTGEVQIVQKHVQIEPSLQQDGDRAQLADALRETLGDVRMLAMRVSLDGTLDQPRCTLWSNLGPAVAESLDRALRRAGDRHTRSLLAESQQCVESQLAGLDEQIRTGQAALLPELAAPALRLERIAETQQTPRRLAPEYLGRSLPANSLFR